VRLTSLRSSSFLFGVPPLRPAHNSMKSNSCHLDKVEQSYESLVSAFNESLKELNQQREALQQERMQFEKEKLQMCKVAVREDDVISLNVGGKLMDCKRSTLCQVEGSLLASMFSGLWEEQLERDKQGRFFLEFNPNCFCKVLDWLRSKRIESPDRPAPLPVIAKDLTAEYHSLVSYLGLADGLKVGLEGVRDVALMSSADKPFDDGFSSELKSDCIALTEEATHTASRLHKYVLGKTVVERGKVKWTLLVKQMLNDHWMMFGVLDASSGQPANGESYSDKGCYGWAKNPTQVYRGGSRTEGWGGYTGDFKTGDTVELTLDCSSSQLSFAVQRTNSCWTLDLPQGKAWRLHLNLYNQNDQVCFLSSVLL